MRERLWAEGFVEVETPILHAIPGGAAAKPFVTHHNALDTDLYLRIAPELFLKRLVVGGFEKVFEIGRLFRNEGLSPRHNPEFTMLELYQAYADYLDLMVLFEELVAGLARDLLGTDVSRLQGRPLSLATPWRRATHGRADRRDTTGLEVDVHTPLAELRRAADAHGVAPEESWGPGKLLLEIYEKTTETELWGPVFVMDYPAEVSPLARRHRDDPDLVERFEPVWPAASWATPSPSWSTPTSSGPGSRSRRRRTRRATRRPMGWTRSTSGPSSTGSRRPPGSGSASTGWPCCWPTCPTSAR